MALATIQPIAAAVPQVRRRQRVALQTPRLSVVIVNYHQWANTAALVRQLLASRAMQTQAGEILVVDNHSPADPVARKLRRWPGVSLRRWGRNRGFARAVNEGCRLSQGEWVLLLNPDMYLPAGFLDDVLAFTGELSFTAPRAGIVGFGLRNADGSRQLSAGFFPTFMGTLTRLLLPRSRRKYGALPETGRCQVDWVTGCCMLIRRQCLKELGGLDADFFLYYEDVDFCHRAQANGWSVWYEPAIEATHLNPLHRRRVPAALRVVTRHSLLTYSLKHWPRWQFQCLSAIIRAEAGWRRLLARCRGQQQTTTLFAELAELTGDMARGSQRAARRRIRRLARTQDFYEEDSCR
jgi:GT2 family glycosyltransferase